MPWSPRLRKNDEGLTASSEERPDECSNIECQTGEIHVAKGLGGTTHRRVEDRRVKDAPHPEDIASQNVEQAASVLARLIREIEDRLDAQHDRRKRRADVVRRFTELRTWNRDGSHSCRQRSVWDKNSCAHHAPHHSRATLLAGTR
jgi:hypothetical protein